MTRQATQVLLWTKEYLGWLVWLSIVTLFAELTFGKMILFTLIEWVITAVFACEYFVRWYEDGFAEDENQTAEREVGHEFYPLSAMGWIDLLAWLPTFLSLFFPSHWLAALRILRLAKKFRYSRSLQLFALSIYKCWWFLKSVLFVVLCFVLLSTVLIYEAEKEAQPDKFTLGGTAYFVMVSSTTVGYGDLTPVTPTGRILTVLLIFMPGIALMGSVLGVIGVSLNDALKVESEASKTGQCPDLFLEYEKAKNEHV